LEKICDLLVEVVVQEGEIVIHEGDTGEKFYIVIKGILVAYKGEGSVI
jgi:CRP-like cAMP-binding protein